MTTSLYCLNVSSVLDIKLFSDSITMSSLLKSKTTFDPIYSLLNASEDKERDELTKRWKDNKLQELSFVGIVVRFSSPSTNIHV